MFPDMGSEHQSVEYLVKYSDVPFEDMERLGLATIKHLIGWEWGMRAFFGNSIGVGYILNRGGTGKAKVLLETKYRIIFKTLQSKYFIKGSTVIDPVIG